MKKQKLENDIYFKRLIKGSIKITPILKDY